jgi:hypothetical protein
MDRSNCYASSLQRLPGISPQFSNLSVHENVGCNNHVTSFASDTIFGLVNICPRKLEGIAAACRKGEASVIHGKGLKDAPVCSSVTS